MSDRTSLVRELLVRQSQQPVWDDRTWVMVNTGLSPGWCQAIIWTKNIANYIQSLGEKLQSSLYRNWYIFIQENAFENVVWKMGAILCWPQYVNRFWKAPYNHFVITNFLNFLCKVACYKYELKNPHFWHELQVAIIKPIADESFLANLNQLH